MDLIEYLNTVGAEFVGEDELKEAADELTALRAENEQWKATMKTAIELGGKQLEELDALRARVAELEAEQGRLRDDLAASFAAGLKIEQRARECEAERLPPREGE